MSRIATSAPTAGREQPQLSLYLRIAALFALSCAFSWWGYGVAIITGIDGFANMFALGPLAAVALIICATEGKSGLRDWYRRMTRFRGPARFYVIAIALPAAIPLASAGFAVIAGAGVPEGSRWAASILPAVVLVVPAAVLFGPVGEEPAFRGDGQYRLQASISPLSAALVIGAGVIAWHLPLMLRGESPVWPLVVVLPAVSVIYAWLYRMSGTIWPAILVHAVTNGVSALYLGEVFDGDAATLRLGFMATAYVVWAAYIVLRYGSSLSRREEQPTLRIRSAGEFAAAAVME
jgi:membrane protease YdiL (CAAX protease family)